MRSITYERAHGTQDALELASEHGERGLFIAGGQSLVNMMKQRLLPEDRVVIDIRQLDELSYIERNDRLFSIGAMTTHSDIVDSDPLSKQLPALPEMVARVGDVQVRNLGTIGGDLAQADPRADYPVLVTASGAEMVAESLDGERTIDAGAFFEGHFETALESDELLREIRIPIPGQNAAVGFEKFAERKGDFPLVNAAAWVETDGERITASRVRVGCIRGTPVQASDTESYLEDTEITAVDAETAGEIAGEEVNAMPDDQTSASYKEELAEAMVSEAVADCLNRVN